MIFGVGTDIVEVGRIERSLLRFGDAFAARILHRQEWPGYRRSATPARFLAKRFAAKEAFAKAYGTGLRAPVSFHNIAIGHDALGKPVLEIAAELQRALDLSGVCRHHLSISDEKALAVAFVVLECA